MINRIIAWSFTLNIKQFSHQALLILLFFAVFLDQFLDNVIIIFSYFEDTAYSFPSKSLRATHTLYLGESCYFPNFWEKNRSDLFPRKVYKPLTWCSCSNLSKKCTLSLLRFVFMLNMFVFFLEKLITHSITQFLSAEKSAIFSLTYTILKLSKIS